MTEALALPPACIVAAAATTTTAGGGGNDDGDAVAEEEPVDEDDPRFGHRGTELLRMEAAWRVEQQLLHLREAAQQGLQGREEGKAGEATFSPPPPLPLSLSPPAALPPGLSHHQQGGAGSFSTSSPRSSPSRVRGTRFRRCASMPVGP